MLSRLASNSWAQAIFLHHPPEQLELQIYPAWRTFFFFFLDLTLNSKVHKGTQGMASSWPLIRSTHRNTQLPTACLPEGRRDGDSEVHRRTSVLTQLQGQR